jgi:chromosome segregation protein
VHLRSLRLRGFKSFPDPVEIRLEPGVAIVVGPNGSGKSNIGDAIRWAAGSLAPHELRAEKPDDVLYAGSATRPAADHCEVELVFDNTEPSPAGEGFGAVEWSELSIVRRLHRGGEGQYLVNRTPVRRLDLVELLADVGLAGEMHSIISQGKVEQILTSKPSDRRALVEAAAGLGKFKQRRHRAELKLARVAQQVERARDLEAEVRKHLRPLALQATAAERAEKLGGEIARLRATIARLDLAALDERGAEGRERKRTAELARGAAQEKLETVLAERGRAEEELADAAGRREQATAALYRLRSAGERVELRRESAAALLERLRAELAAAEEAATPAKPEVERFRLEAAARQEAARAAALEREQALGRLRPVLAALAAAAEESFAAVLAERARLDELQAGAAVEREAAVALLHRLGSAAERAAVRREGAHDLAEQLHAELAGAEEAAARPGPSPEELERIATEAASAARAAALARDELADRARSARERLAALEQSLREREGIPPAARALAEAGERLALSLLEVEPGLERAVAAALAWRASAVLAKDTRTALGLLERARREGLGSLAVVLEPSPRAPAPGAQPCSGARPLAELVGGPEEARSLLGGVWLVDRESLLAAGHGCAVTREGHGYDADRGELWFTGEAAEAVLLEAEARRRALAAEAADLERRLGEADRRAAAATAYAERADAAYGEVAHLRGRRAPDPEACRALAAAAARLEQVLAGAAEAAARIEARLRERAGDAAERAGAVAAELLRLRTVEAERRREVSAAVERLAACDLELARMGLEIDAAPAAGEPDELRDRAAVLAAEAERAAHGAQEAAAAAAAAAEAYEAAAPRRGETADPAVLGMLAAGVARLDEALAAAAAAAARFEHPLRARADAGQLRTAELAEQLRRLGAEEADARRALTETGERLGAIEVELARIDAEAGEVRRRLAEAAGAGEADDEPAEGTEAAGRDELAHRLERLERRRAELGAVNPLAKEDYEREKTRLGELAEQRADLEASLAELEKLRDELTETVERRFADTYRAVERHFAEVAETLFPGGLGRLRLTEQAEEDDEPGIEIELQPAGKRITRLSLLSGGEKALGAISFLFALFLARPCPFYLLDEVEAALDDTNIGRFVELLRRFADRAQFVVVTHQKRTMEAADILYGVTMGPDGVTQVVSKRMPAETAALRTA